MRVTLSQAHISPCLRVDNAIKKKKEGKKEASTTRRHPLNINATSPNIYEFYASFYARQVVRCIVPAKERLMSADGLIVRMVRMRVGRAMLPFNRFRLF